ncbi:Formiminotetrahydrofolate cyclodeaminase [Alkalithermobacter thermoalcaliphilus JW-YL-7 = DSM 7308]|uniref:Formiminotetrahydrofolate cyclodeaminase n=1 Tax=Alkalithermobacter thermoalcaliphilus JW-YL-7 = DSM 7308 TaxID=1121328 RepID=A0A150FRI5_CLOPD|nr:Methenyltetrahydrofolate cyclohydrolase [[Clostridium] paradoxum JW-YL-7 = DSM 7308]SHK42619.1 Formiminotetrahydrofolate cyclodeaminase [[Clostridium] paradoxum JW-YL-7 = DSM 7308]
MRLVDLTIKDFSDQVDSSSPAPGGGSVSALSSNLGVSLSRMMANLSFGKKKYEALDEAIKEEFKSRFEKLGNIRDEFLNLIDEDTKSFNEVMKAFKLPKETEEEKKIRKEAIQQATIKSTQVPLKTAKLSLEALRLMEYFIEYGNQNAITDLGVGSLLVYSGLEGAILNVKVNLLGIDDQELVNNMNKECQDILEEGKKINDNILNQVHERLK